MRLCADCHWLGPLEVEVHAILLLVMGAALPPFSCEPRRSSSVPYQVGRMLAGMVSFLDSPFKTLIVFSTGLPQALAVAAENAATLHAHTLARKVPIWTCPQMFCF